MSDRIFYLGSEKDRKFTGYVPAKFITLNGQPVVDPTPGGSQNAYIYADGSDKYKTRGEIANPNNYLVVPANYTELQARAFAANVANTMNQVYPEDAAGTMGATRAKAQMSDAFSQGGSQDLQRNPRWGIPMGSVAPAFVGSASYHLGSVTRWSGIPRDSTDIPALPPEQQNSQGSALPYAGEYDQYQRQLNGGQPQAPLFDPTKPPPPFDPSNPYPPFASGSIGNWIRSLAGVDLEDPTQFVPPIFSPLYRR